MKHAIRRWLPPFLWMGLIFFFSAQPTLPSAPGRWDLLLKKTSHMLAYAVLTWLYLRALFDRESDGNASDPVATRAVAAGLAFLYALSDEYHQTFVPGRHGNLIDVAVDALGIAAATLLHWRCRQAHGDAGPTSR